MANFAFDTQRITGTPQYVMDTAETFLETIADTELVITHVLGDEQHCTMIIMVSPKDT